MPRGIHAQETMSGWEWRVQDGLGSVRAVVDNTFGVLESRNYDPYGESFGATGTNQTAYGFTGEPTDSNGLLYLRARYYNPAAGVFTALDPFEGMWDEPMSLNGYSYVHGNPVNFVDPSGEIFPGIALVLIAIGLFVVAEAVVLYVNPCTYPNYRQQECEDLANKVRDLCLAPIREIQKVINPISTAPPVETNPSSPGTPIPVETLPPTYLTPGPGYTPVPYPGTTVTPMPISTSPGSPLPAETPVPFPATPPPVPGAFMVEVTPPKVGPNDALVRRGRSWETASRLDRMAKEAQSAGFPHGVSVTTPESNQQFATDPVDAVQATLKALQDAGFNVFSTETRRDKWHHTVELPDPVTPEVARIFNEVLGRTKR